MLDTPFCEKSVYGTWYTKFPASTLLHLQATGCNYTDESDITFYSETEWWLFLMNAAIWVLA
jgi:hypothetical protein